MGGSGSKKEDLTGKAKVPVMKFVTLGLSNAGKSSFLHRLQYGEPPKDFIATIGIDFRILYQDGIKLQAWDFAGRERARTIAKSYYRGASGIFYMIDSASPDQFEESLDFLNSILNDETVMNIPVMVVANKQDLNDAVCPEVIEEKVKQNCKVSRGITLCVMPMSVVTEDDHSLQLAYKLFFKMMKRKKKGKVPNGFIPSAWETAEREAENSEVEEMDEDGNDETKVADKDKEDTVTVKEKEGNLNLTEDGKKKSIFKDPVHIFKSLLIH